MAENIFDRRLNSIFGDSTNCPSKWPHCPKWYAWMFIGPPPTVENSFVSNLFMEIYYSQYISLRYLDPVGLPLFPAPIPSTDK